VIPAERTDRERRRQHADRLRLIVVWLGVCAFVVPLALVCVGGRLLPCLLLTVVFVLAAAAVSVHADTFEE